MVLEKKAFDFNRRGKTYSFFAAVISSLALGTIWLYSQGWQSNFIHCYFRDTFGFIGPGCGLTRSLIALMEGQIQKSISYHAFGPVIFLGLIGLLVFSLKGIFQPKKVISPVPKKARSILLGTFAVSFSVAFISYYSLRIIARYCSEVLPDSFASLEIWQFLITSSNLI